MAPFVLAAPLQILQKRKNGVQLFRRHLVDGVVNSISCLCLLFLVSIEQKHKELSFDRR